MRTNFWRVVVLEDQLVNWKMYANIIMQALKNQPMKHDTKLH